MPPIVETPDTFTCFANKVFPVTVVIPANVDTPTTSKVFVLTSVVLAIPAFMVMVLVAPDPDATTPVPTKLSVDA